MRIPESVRYREPPGPNARSFGKRKGSPPHPVRNTSTSPSNVTRRRDGVWDSATQMTEFLSTARPFGRPVLAITRFLLPSGLMCVTQPRSAPISTTSQLPSPNNTGPSGTLRPEVKIIWMPSLSVRLWIRSSEVAQGNLGESSLPSGETNLAGILFPSRRLR